MTTATSSPRGLSDLRLRRRRLRLRIRPEEAGTRASLFARLSPSVVAALQTDALCRAQLSMAAATAKEEEQQQESPGDGWTIAASSSIERVDFLPLSVKFSPALTIFVSYNGGEASSDSRDGDVLELPASLIPDGFSENDLVHVAALASVKDAEILNVEPLTSADWELLETRAEFLEDGALLQQVSIVYAGQLIPLWVGAKDVAWIRVLPDNFSGGDQQDSVWPEEGMDASQGSSLSSPACCLRLVRDTRVCVAPKPRRQNESSPVSPPLRVYTTKDDYSTLMNDLAESCGKRQLFASPGTAFVHSAMKAHIPGLHPEDNNVLVVLWNAANGPDASQSSYVLQIAFSDDIPERHIAMHPLTRSRLDLIALADAVFFRVLSPIEVARGSTLLDHYAGGGYAPLSLSLVELQEARKGQKWRYPCDDKSHQSFQRLLSRPKVDDDLLYQENEPVEDGSFLFVENVDGKRALYRASVSAGTEPSISPTGQDGEGDVTQSSRSSSSDRCFVLRQDLPQLFPSLVKIQGSPSPKYSVESSVRRNHSQNALPSVSYNLLFSPQLLDLLSETSIISAELLKHQNRASITCDALVCGDGGSGKTHTALALAAIARFTNDCATLYLDCKRLKEGRAIRMKQIQSEFDQLFREASSCIGHVLVILDDLDELAPNMESGANADESSQSQQVNPMAVDQAKLVADTVRRHIEQGPCTAEKSISIIITCRNTRSLHPALMTARPFTRTIPTPDLTAQEREELLWRMIGSGVELDDKFAPGDVWLKTLRIGRKTEGYRPKDLSLLASRVKHMMQCGGGGGGVSELTQETVAQCTNKALEDFTPLRQLSVNEGTSGAVEWSDIGGLFDVKEALTSTMLNPSKYRLIYSKAKIRLPRGVLIFGTPGCGKSYLIPSLAKKCGFSLITCRGPELLDRYIGASESKVRELFARASAASPSILFFDEIDSLAPRRGSDRTGVTDRVVNQLLTLLDGVEETSPGGLVYVVAATSRPDIVDPALLRPGRLEKHVYVGYPESDEELTDLLLKVASRYSVDEAVLQSMSSREFMQDFKLACRNFHRLSAADIKAAFDTAQLNAIHELLQTDRSNHKVTIGRHHLMGALRSTRPSLPERDYAVLMEAYRPFRKDMKGKAGDGDSASGGSLQSRKLRTALR